MELPTGVLAHRLLKIIVISEDKQHLTKATIASFTYDDMKKQLKAIYDNLSEERTSEIIKIEPTYKEKTYDKSGRYDCYYSRGHNSAYRRNKRRGYNEFEENIENVDLRRQPGDSRKTNPPNQHGKVSRCAVCKSIYHWVKDFFS